MLCVDVRGTLQIAASYVDVQVRTVLLAFAAYHRLRHEVDMEVWMLSRRTAHCGVWAAWTDILAIAAY